MLFLVMPLLEDIAVGWVQWINQLEVKLLQFLFEAVVLRDILKETLEDFGSPRQMSEHEHVVVGLTVEVLLGKGVLAGDSLSELAEDNA
jgi:hypothetical protein